MGQQRAGRGSQIAVAILAVVATGLPSVADDPADVRSAAQPTSADDLQSLQPGHTKGEVFDAAAQRAKLEAIQDGAADAETLKVRLRDRDPVIAGAALQALSARSRHEAMEAILQVIDDTTEPVRLQAFQLLLDAPDSDQAVVAKALAKALRDLDSALVVRAIQELVTRDDPESDEALTEALREGDVELRLLIVKSVGTGDNVRPYLFNALHDADERVRAAAEAVLFPSKATR